MDITKLKQFFSSATGRLAASYLAIIMLMSIGFSVVFYHASSHELGRQIPPPSVFGMRHFSEFRGSGPRFDEFFARRIAEGRRALFARLMLLNLLALGGGSVLSYYLARRTLQPIEASLEAQAQFISDASHELRTPLTAIQTANEVALRRPKISTDEAKDILRDNVAEVAKLKSLTDGLLRLAKQDKGDIILVPISLQEVAAEAMNSVVAAAVQKGITVDDAVPDTKVLADKSALSQALVILLDNAIKYSPPKSAIQLKGGRQGKYGYIRVHDEGPGIATSDLPHIFDRFYRADQARNKQKVDGYGIGLALAKKIIDQHHGEISVTSREDEGAVFTFRIPLA